MAIDFRFKLSILLLREADGWVAQCLDYDITAQGQTIAAAKEAFARTFAGQVVVDVQRGVEPLTGFNSAPLEYWSKLRKGPQFVSVNFKC